MVEAVSWEAMVDRGDADAVLAVLRKSGAKRVEMREVVDPPPPIYIAVLEFVDSWEIAAALSPLEALERLAWLR